MINLSFVLLLMLCFLSFCQGCDERRTLPRLDIRIENHSSSDIDQAGVWFNDKKCYAGILGRSFDKTYMYFKGPITDKASVEWVDAKGGKKEKVVDITKVYDFKKSGVLYFEIKDDDVTVGFEPLNK